MPRLYLPPDTVLRPVSPQANTVVLREMTSRAADLDGYRYHDAALGLDFPVRKTRVGRVYYEPDDAPFLALATGDVTTVVRVLAQGASLRALGGAQGILVDGLPAPWLVAALYQDHWSDVDLVRMVHAVSDRRALRRLTHQHRTLLDHALRQGRLVLAEALWTDGVRWSPTTLAQGEPLWSVLQCPFGHWAMALGAFGCTSPAMAERVWARVTQVQASRTMRAVRPLLDRWVDRALNAGADANVLRRLTYRERVDGPLRTLTTGVMGYGLVQALRNLFDDKDRRDLALWLTVRFLAAGAHPGVLLRWDAQPPMALATYARANGLDEAGAVLELALLRADPLPPPSEGRARPRL